MIKQAVLKIIKLFAFKVMFPLSRWHNSNLYLFQIKNPWLKEKPSVVWFIIGRLYWYFQRLIGKIRFFYLEAIVNNYSALVKHHYLENYAYGESVIFSDEYKERFIDSEGSIAELFKNASLVRISGIKDNDSFLECGCGLGQNIKEIFKYFPSAQVTAFDISPNAIEFAKKMFAGKNIKLFQASVLDLSIFKNFASSSIDNIFFANMFGTLLAGSIEETKKARERIIKEAVRIARKNVILNEDWSGPTRIYIEQKYRAIFDEDYSLYFKDMKKEGDIFLFPKFIIFHKKAS